MAGLGGGLAGWLAGLDAGLASGALLSQMRQLATYFRPKLKVGGAEHLKKHG